MEVVSRDTALNVPFIRARLLKPRMNSRPAQECIRVFRNHRYIYFPSEDDYALHRRGISGQYSNEIYIDYGDNYR